MEALPNGNENANGGYLKWETRVQANSLPKRNEKANRDYLSGQMREQTEAVPKGE